MLTINQPVPDIQYPKPHENVLLHASIKFFELIVE